MRAYSVAAKRVYCTHKGVMDVQQLSQSLAENLSALDARFGKSADYYAKKIVLYGCPGCIVMFDGMASLDSLWELFTGFVENAVGSSAK